MTIQIITTSQAPDAKPIAVSKQLTSSWQEIISIPSYEVPQQTFGGGTDIVPGVGEIISPLLISNFSANTATISVRVYRENVDSYFYILKDLPIPINDMVAVPLNGQFIYTGDLLEVQSDTDAAIDITISYTVGQAEQDDVV